MTKIIKVKVDGKDYNLDVEGALQANLLKRPLMHKNGSYFKEESSKSIYMLLLWNETGYLINVNDNAGAVWNYCNVPQGNSIDDELLVRLSANLKLNPINNPFND